ncbi:MAG: hypothetical protein LC112_12370 [Flavobacteriales bacterium]|nr:hypothetical protein [Flavobacteriales bacterium]
MNFLLFGGQPDSGKTSTVTRLTNLLLSAPFSFTIADGIFTSVGGTDFLILLHRIVKGQSQYVIVSSPSDDAAAINNLRDSIIKHSSDKIIDIIISSVRDIDWERGYFFTTIKINPTDANVFEIPLARVTRRHSSGLFAPAINWYENTVDRLVNFIITNPPFNL